MGLRAKAEWRHIGDRTDSERRQIKDIWRLFEGGKRICCKGTTFF